ncbi:MAG: hypothetical protein P1V51_22060 [Deltaproteobacteria bacterium]|nr:hypothetical protein [Deltaproteobacteria bacterium]
MRALLPLLLALGLALPAAADPCQRSATVALGPLQAGPATGALGTPRRACARTELRLGLDAGAIIATSEFYGYLHGGLVLEGSWALRPETELFARMELVRYDSVISSLSASALGPGYLSGGASHRLLALAIGGQPLLLNAYGRVLLPTAVLLDRGSWPLGLEAGATGAWELHPKLDLHAGLALFGDGAFGSGPARPRVGLRLVPGVSYWALSWLAVVGEVDLGMGHAAALDTLGLGLGLRVGGERLGAALELRAPLAGRERHDAALLLTATWRPAG